MKLTTPTDLGMEAACIQRTQVAIDNMRQNLAGLETLNRIHARLEAEIADFVAALDTVARLRAQLWEKQQQDFQQAQAVSAVVNKI